MYVHMCIHASCISSQAFFREDTSQFLDLQEFPQYIHIYIYIYICGKLRGILSLDLTELSQHPRCAIFPISGLAEVFATSKLSFFSFLDLQPSSLHPNYPFSTFLDVHVPNPAIFRIF